MTGLGGMAQSAASSLAPATATQSGLGKWFAAASAIQGLAQVGQGIAQQRAASDEAALQQHQADLTLQQAQMDSEGQARDVRRFASQQGSDYLGSGVTLEGSPALVLAETRRLGQQEVDAIKKRGEYSAQLMRTQAARTKAAGRSALLGSITNSALGGLQNYMQYKSVFAPAKMNTATPLGPVFNPNGPLGQ